MEMQMGVLQSAPQTKQTPTENNTQNYIIKGLELAPRLLPLQLGQKYRA
jgi:hypothetical protein